MTRRPRSSRHPPCRSRRHRQRPRGPADVSSPRLAIDAASAGIIRRVLSFRTHVGVNLQCPACRAKGPVLGSRAHRAMPRQGSVKRGSPKPGSCRGRAVPGWTTIMTRELRQGRCSTGISRVKVLSPRFRPKSAGATVATASAGVWASHTTRSAAPPIATS